MPHTAPDLAVLTKDWKASGKAEGDLNGDSRPDLFLELKIEEEFSFCTLAVYLAEPTGGYRYAGDMQSCMQRSGQMLSIAKGVAVLSVSNPATRTADGDEGTVRLQWDATAKRMRVIGLDAKVTGNRRAGPEMRSLSVDYVTGAEVRESSGKDGTKSGKTKGTPSTIWMEDFDFLVDRGVRIEPDPEPTPVSTEAAAFPLTGKKPQDFAPEGWTIQAETWGNLDGDATTDLVLELKHEEAGVDALVILLGEAKGGYRRAGLSTKVDMYHFAGPGVVDIEKNVVVIKSGRGGTGVEYTLTVRVRWDAAAKRFRVVGRDYDQQGRQEGFDSYSTSTNYVTGVFVRDQYENDQRTKGTPETIWLEDFDFTYDEDM